MRIFVPVKRAFFLLIALGVLFSQLNLPAGMLLEEEISVLPLEESDDSTPVSPMEDYPEENEKEDTQEGKDNDSKKWQQHRLLTKRFISLNKVSWTILGEKRYTNLYISKIQQPPEVSPFI